MENDDAEKWHDAVHHLVHAHGADSALIISRTPTLEQVAFAHLDTHVALDFVSLAPPDGHVHAEPLPPGWPEVRPGAYRPFAPSPEAREDLWFTHGRTSARYSFTGLPHTGCRPGLFGGSGPAHDRLVQEELANWAATIKSRFQRRAAGISAYGVDPPAGVLAGPRAIGRQAVAAHARWLAAAGFLSAPPGPQTWSARGPGPQRRAVSDVDRPHPKPRSS